MLKRLRDWWRGYTDADVESVKAKLRKPATPGAWVPVTRGEYNAAVKLGLC